MNIATIEDILLPVVLFAIYVVFVSVLRYDLKDKSEIVSNRDGQSLEEYPKAFTYQEAFSADYDPDPVTDLAEEIVAQQENVIPVGNQTTEFQEDNQETTIPEIIDSLGKRDIRKLCSPLGIQQKTNGTELTTELMKALVKRKFKENPQKVIEVISDRYPELLPRPTSNAFEVARGASPTWSESNQQQQLDPLAC